MHQMNSKTVMILDSLKGKRTLERPSSSERSKKKKKARPKHRQSHPFENTKRFHRRVLEDTEAQDQSLRILDDRKL